MKKIIGFEALEHRVSLEAALHLSKLFSSEIQRGVYHNNTRDLALRSIQIANLIHMALNPLGKEMLENLRDTIDDLIEKGSFSDYDVSYVEDLKKHYGVESLIVLESDIEDFTLKGLEFLVFKAKMQYGKKISNEIQDIYTTAYREVKESNGDEEKHVKYAIKSLDKLIADFQSIK